MEPPNVKAILSVDFVAAAGIGAAAAGIVCIVGSFWGWAPGNRLPGQAADPGAVEFMRSLSLIGVPIGIAITVWRIRSIRRLVATGHPVTAVVTRHMRGPEYGRLYFRYVADDIEYSASVRFQIRTSRLADVSTGMHLELLIDRGRPTRFLVPLKFEA